MTNIYAYNNTPVNSPLLYEELQAAYPVDYEYHSTIGDDLLIGMSDTFVDTAGLAALVAAHDPEVLTDHQVGQAASAKIVSEVKAIIWDEMRKQNPSVPAVKTAIESALGNQATTILTNAAAFWGYNLATTSDYVKVCWLVISIA